MEQRPPRKRGHLFKRPNSPFWFVKYSQNGVPFRESTKETDIRKAQRYLDRRLQEISSGMFAGLKTERVSVSELFQDLLRDYKINGRKSLDDLESRWEEHLKKFFAHLKAVQVTTQLVARYIDKRQTEGAANATINRELAALKRAFNLGSRSTPPKVLRVPYIPHLAENNVRTGFLENHQYEKLADIFGGVGLWMRAIFEVGYSYGWRISEVLNLRVKQVDLANSLIRLDTGTTKNKRGRVVKMTEIIFHLLQQCCAGKQADDYVFTRFLNGRHKPVRDFRVVWKNGCTAAGVPDLLFHDLRRSGARNLVRAGVAPHHAAMITGHKTLSVFNRYDIIDERDIAEAVEKLERHQKSNLSPISVPTPPPEPAQPENVPQNDIQ